MNNPDIAAKKYLVCYIGVVYAQGYEKFKIVTS